MPTDSTTSAPPTSDFLTTCLYGASRGILVQSLLYPLEVVKTNQQASTTYASSREVTSHLWKTKGPLAFYSGLSPHLAKTILRQAWWWPAIIYIPPALKERGYSTFMQQALAGVAVATIDAVITTPLEQKRILASVQKKTENLLPSPIKNGWVGVIPYWRQQSITWAALLVGQKHFREKRAKEPRIQKHSHFVDLLDTSLRLSAIAAIITTPFNTANVLKQSSGKSLSQSVGKTNRSFFSSVRYMYRGLPLNFTMLMCQVSATVVLIDHLEPQKNRKTQ
jgi:hypothetical protein